MMPQTESKGKRVTSYPLFLNIIYRHSYYLKFSGSPLALLESTAYNYTLPSWRSFYHNSAPEGVANGVCEKILHLDRNSEEGKYYFVTFGSYLILLP